MQIMYEKLFLSFVKILKQTLQNNKDKRFFAYKYVVK